MRVIFVHHALREKENPLAQTDGLKPLGIQDAELTGKILEEVYRKQKNRNIVGIFSSPFFRCMETAKLINKSLGLEIYEDERLNEFRPAYKEETWLDLQNRVRECIRDVVTKYNEEDVAIFVTSGVNIVAFISLIFYQSPKENAPFIKIPSCSPIGFDIDKSFFQE